MAEHLKPKSIQPRCTDRKDTLFPMYNEFNNPVEWDPCPLILLGLSSFRAEAEMDSCLGPAERALAAAELWTKLGNALRSRTEDIPTYR